MELEELHVLERHARTPDDGLPIAGQRMRVGRHAEHAARSAGREQHGLRPEDVKLARRELVRHDARRPAVAGAEQVEHVELVEESHVALHALLVQRLEDHVAGPVGRVARALDRRLAMVPRVAAEPPLVDPTVRRPVERQAPVLELVDRVDRFLGHELCGRLVDEVVAALDRVERVPLGVVLLDVRERGADAALGRPGVRARRVELGDHGGAHAVRGFDRRAKSRAAGADDQRVVGVGDGHDAPGHLLGSNVNTTTVPSANNANPIT
jgi:hypothetical protein